MKITVLHGQKHHGSTWNSTRLLLDSIISEGDECNEFFLNDMPDCIGCFTCILKDEEKCPHRSVVKPIIQAIDKSDILIVETPNYCMGMPGQLKTFFDHMAYRWVSHSPLGEMENKVAIAVSTTAGAGAGVATKQIKRQLFWWGIPIVYRLNQAVAASKWDDVKPKIKHKLKQKAEKIAAKAKKRHGRVHRGLRQKFLFKMMGAMQKSGYGTPKDAAYWKANGWI
ncbi:MAG: NAD(P)H-dependent oxidoreductase [Eubacteriales bacterium]|nr:NAD(P)H-dependent oxidoreductase [Eubacteriales bacterium]